MIDPKGEHLRRMISSLEHKIKDKQQELNCLTPSNNQVCMSIDYNEIQRRKIELLVLETTCYSLKKYHIVTVF